MKIRGNTVGTPMPRADYAQEDPKKADYIKNKPNLEEMFNDQKSEIMVEVDKRATTAAYTGTLSYSGWTGSAAPYTQTATVAGLLKTDNPFVDIDLSNVDNEQAVIEGWILVGRVTVTADNTIVAYCYDEKPAVNIPIILKVVR